MPKVLWVAMAPVLLLHVAAAPSGAVNLVIDYTYDTSYFFGSGNPDGSAAGAQAKAALEAAADYYSEILTDTLSAIETPEPFISTGGSGQPDRTVTWSWDMIFDNPTTNASVTLTDESIVADEFRIYVGAQNLSGSTLAFAGPGGWSAGSDGTFYTPDAAEVNAINDAFISSIQYRGEPTTEFGRWGGTAAFDTSANWHYDHTTQPAWNESDFYSVAVHELAHTLGFGTSSQWSDQVIGSQFFGVASTAANGFVAPSVTGGHWAEGTESEILGTSTTQETSFDPNISAGDRIYLTALDAAGLEDIGWTIDPIAPPMPTPQTPGDYNGDLVVDAADYAAWRNSLSSGSVIGSYAEWRANYGASYPGTAAGIPEPATAVLGLVGGTLALALRRRR